MEARTNLMSKRAVLFNYMVRSFNYLFKAVSHCWRKTKNSIFSHLILFHSTKKEQIVWFMIVSILCSGKVHFCLEVFVDFLKKGLYLVRIHCIMNYVGMLHFYEWEKRTDLMNLLTGLLHEEWQLPPLRCLRLPSLHLHTHTQGFVSGDSP